MEGLRKRGGLLFLRSPSLTLWEQRPPLYPLPSMTLPSCPPGGGKGLESPPVHRAEPVCSLPACSNQSFAFGTGGRTHPSPYGGRHEVTTRVLPFVRTPARRRRDCRGLYERGSGPPLFFCFIPVCSDSISCALRAGERGLLWGRCPPSRPLSTPRITPRTSR